MYWLVNEIRDYSWGSPTVLPQLLGTDPTGQPQAELWLGAHPSLPSTLAPARDRPEAGEPTPLDRAIAQRPAELLGDDAHRRFGPRLPFLLKVLAAERPLSLQAHPDAAHARRGYAADNAAGLAPDAPTRNYRDPFHKPELVLALEPFEVLCGFRSPAAVCADLMDLPGAVPNQLRADLQEPDPHVALRRAFTTALYGPERPDNPEDAEEAEEAPAATPAVLAEALESRPQAELSDNQRTLVELARHYPKDPGVIATLLLHRVSLRPGEALFLPPGNVHAYLRGAAVELMASSDNVLRAGMTTKHVDVAELLATVDFSPGPVPWVTSVSEGPRTHYPCAAVEFALNILQPRPQQPACAPGGRPRIALCLRGEAQFHGQDHGHGHGQTLRASRGMSVFLGADDGTVTVSGDATVVLAST